jgi:hypothetical protein
MTVGVWHTTFQVAVLPDVLKSYVERLRYVYLESPVRVALLPFADGAAEAMRAHTGRAFGPTLEVRWRRLDTLIDAQLLWEEGHAPPDLPENQIKWSASKWNALFEPTPRTRTLLLSDRPDSTLRCLDYLCEGVVVLTRLCDIAPPSRERKI